MCRLQVWPVFVRLKITRQLSGSIDGVQLSHFQEGELYDVGTSLGSYLLALGAAEPVMDESPAGIVPFEPRTSADDRSDRPTRKR
jgi:hypothetical protein